MKKKCIYSIDKLPIGKTDWERVAKMSNKEVEAAARTDKDAPIQTKKQLAKFKRVNPFRATDIKHIRKKLNMTQALFAAYFGISKRTLQEWEQGRRHPEGPSCTLLMVIAQEPKAVKRALLHKR
jgi:putative transcriptional regulator